MVWTRGAGTLLDLDVTDSTQEAGKRSGRDYRTRRLLVLADLIALLCGIGSWWLLRVPDPSAHALWTLITVPVMPEEPGPAREASP